MRLPRPRVSFGGCAGFSAFWGRAISAPMSDGTIYQVSIVEKQPSGQNLIHILLRTSVLEDANALVNSLEQDGQKTRFEIIPPGRTD